LVYSGRFVGGANASRARSPASEWLQIRKDAALTVDPETVKVDWCYGQLNVPYNVRGLKPGDPDWCPSRLFFAIVPGPVEQARMARNSLERGSRSQVGVHTRTVQP
jgi:hypothetical protein